jgi:hypothetical protein
MSTINFLPRHPSAPSESNSLKDLSSLFSYSEKALTPSMAGITLSSEPVVVFFPSGNYNQLTELGRYKNLSVAVGILSSINHPDNTYQIPEYLIFSLETGQQIHLN